MKVRVVYKYFGELRLSPTSIGPRKRFDDIGHFIIISSASVLEVQHTEFTRYRPLQLL